MTWPFKTSKAYKIICWYLDILKLTNEATLEYSLLSNKDWICSNKIILQYNELQLMNYNFRIRLDFRI